MAVRVQVFAKAPVAGEVKTRLIPRLGAAGAAKLQCGLIACALDTAFASGIGAVELWCAPAADHPAFTPFAGRGAALCDQGPGDLGTRMLRALRGAQIQGDAAVLIGSDCPALTTQDLKVAANALTAGMDAVIAPADDGGYVLIAARYARVELFENIAWGSELVIEQTRMRMVKLGWRWQELPTRWDVDRPEDYDRLIREQLIEQHAGA
ncbi:MAG: TIGR04282 family arsenosugar biosynthesis glycosyltransferase [Burkholderiales bacterium]